MALAENLPAILGLGRNARGIEMKVLSISSCVVALAGPAAAECIDEVKALFVGGPIDPFSRPAWRETTVKIAPDGSETHVVDATWQDPTRVLSYSNNMYITAIGPDTWMAQSADGPWTASGAYLPEDVEAFHKFTNETLMRNMTDVECHGTSKLDGQAVVTYSYRTKTDPNEYGSWFGGLHRAFIDVESNLLVRMEVRESVASWAPEKSEDLTVTTLVYDPTIRIERPE